MKVVDEELAYRPFIYGQGKTRKIEGRNEKREGRRGKEMRLGGNEKEGKKRKEKKRKEKKRKEKKRKEKKGKENRREEMSVLPTFVSYNARIMIL